MADIPGGDEVTIQELYKLKNIRATRKVLLNQVKTLNLYGEENADIRKILSKAVGELYGLEFEEETKLRELAQSIEDEQIRQIIRLRFIQGLPWADVAAEVAPLEKDTTHSAPLMKIRRFLRSGEKSSQNVTH